MMSTIMILALVFIIGLLIALIIVSCIRGGPLGPTGSQGPPGTVNFITPQNIYVDSQTPQDPLTADGSISSPFNSITAALNALVEPTSLNSYNMGTTIIIASGQYDENLIIDADSTRVTLLALGTVILGGATAVGNVTITLTNANNNFGSSFSSAVTFDSDVNLAFDGTNVTQFTINGSVTVNNKNTGFASPNTDVFVNFSNTFVIGSIALTSATAFIALNFNSSHIVGAITGVNQVTAINEALNTSFDSLVQIGLFNYANNCRIRAGVTNYQNTQRVGQQGTNFGFINCSFDNIYTGNSSSAAIMYLDGYTNFYLKNFNSNATPVVNATAVVMGDLSPAP